MEALATTGSEVITVSVPQAKLDWFVIWMMLVHQILAVLQTQSVKQVLSMGLTNADAQLVTLAIIATKTSTNVKKVKIIIVKERRFFISITKFFET